MKNERLLVTIVNAAFLLLGLAASEFAQEKPKPRINAGFDHLKSLVGEWQGTNAKGEPARVVYELVSNGSALLERLFDYGEPEMVSVYSSDADRLVMTHYCSSGNQPQLRSAPVSTASKRFTFEFTRATNLASLAEGHMGKLVVTLQDHEHFTQEWTWTEGGRPADTAVLRFVRKN